VGAIYIVCHCSIRAAVQWQTSQYVAMGGNTVAQEGIGSSGVLFEATGKGDGTLRMDGSSNMLCGDNDDIAVPKGAGSGGDDGGLHTDDGRSTWTSIVTHQAEVVASTHLSHPILRKK
jgi:hypothetical protein